MNASKQYNVRDWVKDNAADRAEIAKILEAHPLWKPKHAKDLLARRRFHNKVIDRTAKEAGKK